MLTEKILNSSIELLEGDIDETTVYTKSSLHHRCMAARQTPLGKLSLESIRLLIEQSIGLKYVVPIALDKLSMDPLLEGDLYKGDLLSAVLQISPEYWKSNVELNNELVGVKEDINEIYELIKSDFLPKFKDLEYL